MENVSKSNPISEEDFKRVQKQLNQGTVRIDSARELRTLAWPCAYMANKIEDSGDGCTATYMRNFIKVGEASFLTFSTVSTLASALTSRKEMTIMVPRTLPEMFELIKDYTVCPADLGFTNREIHEISI